MSGIIGTLKKEYLYLLQNVMKDFKDELMCKLKLSNVQTFVKWEY